MIAGRYTLDREIGRGGMGAVWLGRDEVLGRAVAIKRVGMLPGGSSPDLERAEREGRIAAQLNHPHVVAVFDLVVEDHSQWLVMEYVEGTNLSELVTANGSLSPDEAAPLLAQAAEALAVAHTSGIVHRDVKPSNLLVTADGQVKLTDFGIARAEADASLTQTGLVTGSPAYLAPEVASGMLATGSSDVWSLGATLYHALVGRPPYDIGDNLVGGLYRIVHEEPPRVEGAGWLAPLLESTMTRDPEARWPMERVARFLAAGPREATQVGDPAPQVTQQLAPVPAAPPTAALAPPPPAATPRSGRRRASPGRLVPLMIAAIILSVVALIGITISLNSGNNDDPAADETTGSSTSSSPSDTPPGRPTEQDMVDFVETYVATAVSDQRAAYEMLTPQFQESSGNFGGYNGFWSTIESASVSNLTADPASLLVSYDIAYQRRSGGEANGSVQLQLDFTDGVYRIAAEA